MDFDKINTDHLKSLFPPAENENWEFKDAAYLLKDKRTELNTELATQASAFANTGGGYLVFGYPDKERNPQPCEEHVGGQLMRDWLSVKIHQSVEYPLQSFRVHRIPIATEPSKAVFLIVFADSPKAPHQSKVDQKYYWRIGSSSKPAPHFHLELLRSRYTSTVLVIDDISHSCEFLEIESKTSRPDSLRTRIRITFNVRVKNVSDLAATAWGVLLEGGTFPNVWRLRADSSYINAHHQAINGIVRGAPSTLLPGERATLAIQVDGDIDTIPDSDNHWHNVLQSFIYLNLQFVPVSHNYIGGPYAFEPGMNDSTVCQFAAFVRDRKPDFSPDLNDYFVAYRRYSGREHGSA